MDNNKQTVFYYKHYFSTKVLPKLPKPIPYCQCCQKEVSLELMKQCYWYYETQSTYHLK